MKFDIVPLCALSPSNGLIYPFLIISSDMAWTFFFQEIERKAANHFLTTLIVNKGSLIFLIT